MIKSKLEKWGVDLKLVGWLAAFYTLFNIVYLTKIAYLRSTAEEPPTNSLLSVIVDILIFDWIVVIFYMTLVSISTKRLIKKKFSWIKIFLLHIFFSLFIGLVIRMIADLYNVVTGKLGLTDYDMSYSLRRFVYVMDLNFLIYFAMIFMIYFYYYLKQVKQSERLQAELKTQLVDSRMKVLQSQLQPHFLFNTLNTVSGLICINGKKAQDMVADLSSFLRLVLYSNDEHFIKLREELGTLEYYLNIIRVRFSEDLKITKDIDISLLSTKVPPLLIQPIIENSVKHGYSRHHPNLTICLSIKRRNGKIDILISNNGNLLTEKFDNLLLKGVGLQNMKERLTNLYGDNFTFTIQNEKTMTGVETHIQIPISY